MNSDSFQSHGNGNSMPPSSNNGTSIAGSQYSQEYNDPYNQIILGNMYSGNRAFTFASSKGSRSLANSAALIPCAKFLWGSESIGTQSTVMTRRSMVIAQAVPEPHHEKEGNKAMEGGVWASFA